MTETQSAIAAPAASPALEYAAPAPPRRWHAGTLTYTAGALAALFFFLLWGDFAWALKERAAPPILQVLLKQFKASDIVVATLIGFLPQATAFIIVPIVSCRSDRHRGRWGRRIPFLLLPTPLAVLSMIGLAVSPTIGAWLASINGLAAAHPKATVILSFSVFWAMFEVSSAVCQAVFTGLINDVVPREVIGRFYGLFRIFGLSAGMVFNYALFGHANEYYATIFIGLALLYGVSFTVMCLRIKEPAYDPAPPQESSQRGLRASAQTYVRECFGNRQFVPYYVAMGLANMAFQPVLLFSLYFATSLGMSHDTFGKITTLQLFISLVQAYPLGWLADRIGPLRVTIFATALYALVTAGSFLFARDGTSFAIAHVACGVLAGCWLTATAALPPAILPRDKFAQFNSAMWLCTSLAVMLAAPVSGWLMDWTKQHYALIYLWAAVCMTLSLAAILVFARRREMRIS